MSFIDAYIGLGSNLADPQAQVRTALAELDEISNTNLVKASSLYVSKPMGPSDQPDYINAVAKISTQLSPEELLTALQEIEQDHQRKRKQERWGPRTLDLDIIMYGEQQMDTKKLQIPHYGVAVREFVLVPLQELQADLYIPGKGAVADLIDKLPSYILERIENSG